MPDTSAFEDARVGAALDLLSAAHTPDVDHALLHQRALQAQGRITAAPMQPRRSFMDRALAGLAIWRRPMPAIPIAAALLITLSLFTSPVQSLASQFLTIFRVQDFAIVSIPAGSEMSTFFAGLPELSTFGDMQPSAPTHVQSQPVADLAAASNAVGFTLHTPTSLPNTVQSQPSTIGVTPAQSYTFTFRLAKAQAYLQSLNRTDVVLPAKFDGASLQFNVPATAMLTYAPKSSEPAGNSASNNAALASGVVIVELKSPSVDASGVSYDDLRTFLLSLPGLPPSVAATLKSLPDPSSTLPVPVPAGISAQKTQVNGAPAVIFADQHSSIAGGILWQSGGVLYGVGGPLNQSEVLAVATSMAK
ncbi:MAG: hypothetical protein QOF51_3528 [Chloroflexota bacterium]|jgi:hypothetical protein|nr:hypothetical protein [Chloroflexota bacterium]